MMAKSLLLALLSIPALMVFVAGCDEDSSPRTQPSDRFPDSPDQLMSNFTAAIAGMDSASYLELLHPDYRFYFHETDVSQLSLANDHLTFGEEVNAALNMFSGEVVANFFGGIEAGISHIGIDLFEPVDEWSDSEATSEFPGTTRRLYAVGLSIERLGNATLVIEGQQEFFVTSFDSVLSGTVSKPYYRLIGQRDLTVTSLQKDSLPMSWGRIKRSYLTNQPPVAAFQFERIPDTLDPTWQFDASASFDPDTGLDEQPFRWRFEYLGPWTDWSADAVITHAFTAWPAVRAVTLQVRDHWSAYGIEGITLEIRGGFPDTRDKLMDNFLVAYGGMDLAAYRETLGNRYKFYFLQQDVENLTLPSDHLTRSEELLVSANMFGGGCEAPISAISFDIFEPETPWQPSGNHPYFPDTVQRVYRFAMTVERPGSTTLEIEGLQEFFAANYDSTLSDSTTRQYWQLVGQIDRSAGSGGKAVESATWGIMKALCR